jgi:hypothetical protein
MIGCRHWPPIRRPQGRFNLIVGRPGWGKSGKKRNIDDLRRLPRPQRAGPAGSGRQLIEDRLVVWSPETTAQLTLSELRITKTQSSRWQKLAALPAEKFEERLEAFERKAVASVDSAQNPRLKRPMQAKREVALGAIRAGLFYPCRRGDSEIGCGRLAKAFSTTSDPVSAPRSRRKSLGLHLKHPLIFSNVISIS